MDGNLLATNPFAILTNATSVLAMSAINRMLRTRDRMHELFRESATVAADDPTFIGRVNRVEATSRLSIECATLDLCCAGGIRRRQPGDIARGIVRRTGT